MAENDNASSTKVQDSESPSVEELAHLDFVNEILQEKAPEFVLQQQSEAEVLASAQLATDEIKLTTKDKAWILIKKILWFFGAGFVFLGQLLTKQWQFFKALKGIQKVAVVGIVLGSMGLTGYFYMIQRKHWVPEKTGPLFMNSMEEWSSAKYFFDPKKDREAFYESIRVPKYLFQLSKIYVNLQSSHRSETRSIGAFEFIIEGSVAEVTAQMKKSEGKFLDITQSVVEKFTFDQLETIGGKEELVETLRREYSQHIDTGLVRKVFIKNMILKP